MSVDATAKRERRRKQLLAEYYGKDKTSGRSTSSASAAQDDTADKLNLEGPHFDAAAYCDSLIGSESLAALLKRDNALEHEIVALDGEMKTLVYENYNKFISATDTIKQMKSNVDHLDTEMAALEARMAAIGVRANRVDSQLKPKRDALLQLDTVHRLLQKVTIIIRRERKRKISKRNSVV
jgi:hypothetical protein